MSISSVEELETLMSYLRNDILIITFETDKID